MALEHYKSFFSRRWGCSDALEDVPDKIRAKMIDHGAVDPSTERVLAAAYVDSWGIRGEWFVLVTEDRVIAKKNATIDQSLFKDVKNVEKDGPNVKIHSDHSVFEIFANVTMPKHTLGERLFGVINRQWLAVRRR